MQNYSCKKCGAILYWDIDCGCLKCKFCHTEYGVNDFEDHTKMGFDVENEEADAEFTSSGHLGDDMVVYKCNHCDGEVVALKTTMATICPYCSEAISITSKSVGNFRPKLCIPFSKSKKEIIEAYKRYVKTSLLTPKSFKDENSIEKIQGLFVPFYLNDIDMNSTHEFEGELTHSDRDKYNNNVTRHDVFKLKAEMTGQFYRIPTDASIRVANDLMDWIEPFDYDELKPFNPAYMAGFMAEQKDDNKTDTSNRAALRAQTFLREVAQEEFKNYKEVELQQESSDIVYHETSYTMLPIWLLNIVHNNKKYTFAVNGQTGKVVGKLPIDMIKLLFMSLGFGTIAYVIMHMIWNLNPIWYLISTVFVLSALVIDHNFANKTSSADKYLLEESCSVVNKEEIFIRSYYE